VKKFQKIFNFSKIKDKKMKFYEKRKFFFIFKKVFQFYATKKIWLKATIVKEFNAKLGLVFSNVQKVKFVTVEIQK